MRFNNRKWGVYNEEDGGNLLILSVFEDTINFVKKFNKLIDMWFIKRHWQVYNEEDGGDILKFTVAEDVVNNKIIPLKLNIVVELNNGHLRYCLDDDYFLYSKKIFTHFVGNSAFIVKASKNVQKIGRDLLVHGQRVAKMDLTKLSNHQIQVLINQWKDKYQALVNWGLLFVFVDMGTNYLTNGANQALSKSQLPKGVSVPEAFSILSTPLYKTAIFKEEEGLMNLANAASRDQKLAKFILHNDYRQLPIRFPLFDKKIKNHLRKFAWVYYAYEGPALETGDVLKRLGELINEKNLSKKIIEKKNYLLDLRTRQGRLLKGAKLTKSAQILIKLAKETMLIKGLRKDFMFQSFYLMEGLFKEICRRTGLSWGQVHHLRPEEVEAVLKGKIGSQELNDRIKHCAYFSTGELVTGGAAQKFADLLSHEVSDDKQITGQCACPGSARGKVKIINKREEMGKMEVGDILVSVATTPEVVSAMKKAAAIVTEIGGISCHAAIVSRELKIPCVIGTKIATKILKDGDMVEVLADEGIVNIIEVGSYAKK